MERITFALTSCGRLDLLDRTISSFRVMNTHPIERWIMVEDSGNHEIHAELQRRYPEFEILFNEERLGPIKSLHRLYATIETPWIMHCEDDWEFVRPGFIEKSLAILQMSGNEHLLLVALRGTDSGENNGHPMMWDEQGVAKGVKYVLSKGNYMGCWCGYGTNPALRRLADYLVVDKSLTMEQHISMQYMKMGKRTAVLMEEPHIKHIGAGKSAYFGQYPGLPAFTP